MIQNLSASMLKLKWSPTMIKFLIQSGGHLVFPQDVVENIFFDIGPDLSS